MKRTKICGKVFYLRGDAIDTDRIIPARFLRCLTFEGMGEHVFEDDRLKLAGEHPFDKQLNRDAMVLIGDSNFGCGSSREHAVAALQRYGIKAIVAKSIANIFRSNSTANGLVCVCVSPDDHAVIVQLVQSAEQQAYFQQFEVDLESMTVSYQNQTWPCTMPPAHRHILLEGGNITEILLKAKPLIEETAKRLPNLQQEVA